MRKFACASVAAVIVLAALLDGRPAGAQLQPNEQQIQMPGSPFAVKTTPDGRWAFVSVQSDNGTAVTGTNGIAVLERMAQAYRLAGFVPMANRPHGLAVSRDGTLLLAAATRGVAVFDVQRIVTGASGPLLGFQTLGNGFETIEVALSTDQRFVFAANEFAGTISVIDLANAIRSGFAGSSVIGQIPADFHPVGLAVSRDGAHLYVTNERANPGTPGFNPNACRVQTGPGTFEQAPEGTILVVDTAVAETTPSSAVASRVLAGCSPVRIRLTASDDDEEPFVESRVRDDGAVAWVSMRGEDQLKAFQASRLLNDPARALLASVPVGPAPVGVQPFAHGNLIAVANSNRFSGGMPGSVSIISTGEALGHEPATLKTFAVGVFPREWALSPDRTKLFLTEFGSSMLDIFDVRDVVRYGAHE